MRNLLLISMLVMAPLSFATYHGGGSGDSSSGGSSGGGGYGSGSSGAAAGLLLVGGLIYFLNRDSDEEVTEEFALVSKNKVNKFEFNFINDDSLVFEDAFRPTNFSMPQNNFQLNVFIQEGNMPFGSILPYEIQELIISMNIEPYQNLEKYVKLHILPVIDYMKEQKKFRSGEESSVVLLHEDE